MLQTISLDSKTILIKADVESDLSVILDYFNKKNKQKRLEELLDFADLHYKTEPGFKFNREECYDR
jgi:hypothetical protein